MKQGEYHFLEGGGEMGALTRAKDWATTPVGAVENWPQSLRTTLGIVLNSQFPMFLWWGPDLVCFYNDAYRPSLGENGKHPHILGMKAKEAWSEIWDIIKPMIDQVLQEGKGVWNENTLIPIYRNGEIEDAYWTFSYGPVHDESGHIAGVLVTCTETTETIRIHKNLEESGEQLHFAIEAAELGTWDYNPITHKFYANHRTRSWFGLSLDDEVGISDSLNVISDDDKPSVEKAIAEALQFSSGGNYSIEYTIVQPDTKERITVQVRGKVFFNESKQAIRFNGTMQDITNQVNARRKVEESEKRFRNVADSAPVLIWMSDTNKKSYFFNKAWLEFTGRTELQESGDGWKEGIHPEDYDRFIGHNSASFDARKSFYIEYRLKRYDGEYRWLSENGTPRFTADGIFEGYVGACMDIHERVVNRKKLIENEERLQIVIKASDLATWKLNVKTSEVSYSDRYLEILGYEKDAELTHEQILKHLHPNDLKIRKKAYLEAYRTGTLHYASRIIWNDGSIHWIEGRGKVFYDEENKPDHLIGTVRDITEERNYQQRLLEREQKFRLLADSMPQFIWTSDLNGNLNYFNEAVYKYTGLNKDDIFKGGWLQIVHPEERRENIAEWLQSVRSGEDFLFEHRFKRHDGEYRWQLSRAIPQRDADGKIQMWVGTSTDIQEQKMFAQELEKLVRERTRKLNEMNEALAKSEERYHLMVAEILDYSIIYLSPEGTIENWNKGAERIKGYKAAEIIGKHFSIFYTAEDRKNHLPQRLIEQSVHTGRAIQEGWRVRKDGSLFWASVVITAIHDEENSIIGFSKVTHDLTEKKQASDKIKLNAAQLELKNKELEKMNAELKSFAYISSHDLQEPVRKIQTFATRIMEKEMDALSETGKNYFIRMKDESYRMQTLIEDLLAYTRTGTTERIFKRTDLKEVVAEVKEEFADVLAHNQGTIDVGPMCLVNVIPFQIRQLLQNLISNSLKFAKAETPSRIEVSSRIVDGSEVKNARLSPQIKYCHLSISDNGIGFEAQYKDRIFEVFQRLHGKHQYKGTGIGLAIVKKIVENHNGVIVATSELGEGATFDIYLPI